MTNIKKLLRLGGVTGLLGALTATSALAGGIQRSEQDVGLLFEQGNVARFSLAVVSPSISGTDPISLSTGNMANSVAFPSGGVKWDHNEKLSFAILYDQPFGADIAYNEGLYAGTNAFIRSNAVTPMVRYKFGNGFSIHGGPRFQTLDAGLTQSGGGTGLYSMGLENSQGIGGSIGVAYEIPEMFLRVALTYNSKVNHKYDNAQEVVLGSASTTSFETDTPQSLNLDLQAALSPTLIGFGKVRWVDWSEYNISPPAYVGAGAPVNAAGVPLDSYPDDTTSFEFGAVKIFNPQWFGVASASYEEGHDRPTDALGPFKGYTALSLAAIHNLNANTSITFGGKYFNLGDVTGPAGDFSDNNAFAFAASMDYRF